MMPTVNSRPGRNSSTMTGCLKSSRSSAQSGQSERAIVHDRFRGDPLARPLGHRLEKVGRREANRRGVGLVLDEREIGRRNPRVADDVLRHALVQGERHDERIGEGVGDLVEIEDRRHLRLAPGAAKPLGDVEDEVPPVSPGEPLDEPPGVADPIGRVPEPPYRASRARRSFPRDRTRRSLPRRTPWRGTRP